MVFNWLLKLERRQKINEWRFWWGFERGGDFERRYRMYKHFAIKELAQ